mmetsp:Transcript_3662/g.13434  ORF Transcript_3662/g.13434 Transcript_3662/m.13434 type:complete len:206 (+) Transcript_3662:7238-7855(+)
MCSTLRRGRSSANVPSARPLSSSLHAACVAPCCGPMPMSAGDAAQKSSSAAELACTTRHASTSTTQMGSPTSSKTSRSPAAASYTRFVNMSGRTGTERGTEARVPVSVPLMVLLLGDSAPSDRAPGTDVAFGADAVGGFLAPGPMRAGGRASASGAAPAPPLAAAIAAGPSSRRLVPHRRPRDHPSPPARSPPTALDARTRHTQD